MSSTTRIKPGAQIARGKKLNIASFQRGTAGIFVTKTTDAAARGILTCAHVLGGKQTGEDPNVVYSPEFIYKCNFECNDPIGKVDPATLFERPDALSDTNKGLPRAPSKHLIGPNTFVTDTSVVMLDPAVLAKNDIPEIGPVFEIRDLIAELAHLFPADDATTDVIVLPEDKWISVKKYGATTSGTTGKVKRFIKQELQLVSGGVAGPIELGWVIEIDPDPESKPFAAEYEIAIAQYVKSGFALDDIDLVVAPFNGTPERPAITTATVLPDRKRVKVKGCLFSQSGDSGSALVDDDGKLVGIVRGSTIVELFVVNGDGFEIIDVHTGHSQAVFIRAAFEELKIRLLTAAEETGGERIIVPGMSIAPRPPQPQPFDSDAIDRAFRALEAAPRGAELIALAHRHFPEVRQLVHHRRRVLVAWHRFRGPAFVTAILRSSSEAGWPLPAEIEGVTLESALSAMRNVLLAEGSDALTNAILHHEHAVFELARGAPSIATVLEQLAGARA